MKTTIDIAEPLLREAKKAAQEGDTTLRELVEQGLKRVLSERQKKNAYRLEDRSVGGEGLDAAALGDGGWDRLRELAYET